MEGERITFIITHGDRDALFTMSEYDTVEHLKMEIDNNFDISVTSQIINGWHRQPSSDDTILKECCNMDINFLEVMTTQTNEKTCYDEFIDNGKKENETEEGEFGAIRTLNEKLPINLPITFNFMLFDDAVAYIIDQKKALLLYLHNSQDSFSSQFLALARDTEISSILEENFCIIGWDVENRCFHDILIKTLERYSSLSIIPRLITDKIGAAICLLPDNSDMALFFCLKGDITYENVKEKLTLVQEQCKNEKVETSDVDASMEIEAIKSLRRKLPSDISVTLRHCTLEDAIKFICTSSFQERKALLLYLHNSEHPFSKMFSQSLKNQELAQILNRNFLVLGWDVENSDYHSALVSALCQHPNLAIVADLVTSKVSVALCILPIDGTINLYLCLRGKVTLKDAVKSLMETEKVFQNEIEKEKELLRLEEEKSNKNDIGSEKLHSIWADMLGDRDYDCFEFDQHEFLKEKIGYGLQGPPKKESGYEEDTLKIVKELYGIISTESNKIAEYRNQIEIAFIYNCLEPLPQEKIKRAKKFEDYNPQTDVKPVPVFVLRKCRGGVTNPCRVFIDHTGRVYQNWNGYLTKNKFEECEMIVPSNGRYTVVNERVLLERHLSPACHLDTKLLQVGDMVGVAAGLASGAVFMTAAAGIAALPVAAPLLIAAGVTGGAVGVWTLGRSIYTLIDRSQHKESLSFANSEARGAYINIVAGSLGFVGAGANMAITQLAARGVNIGQGATYAINTVQVLNLGASGASLANSGYEVFDQWYNENQTPSALTIIQLSSSILFFGHAVYNFRGVQAIVDETQTRVLKDYQDSLRSNRHRKTFNKLMKETIRTTGDNTRGRAEVISAIRNIQNKDEVFASLTRNNRAMNKAGVRFSAEGGQITLGGMTVDMNEFIGLNKKQSETFLGNLAQRQTTQQPVSTGTGRTAINTTLTTAVKNVLSDIKVNISNVNLDQLLTLTSKLLCFCSGDVQAKVVNAIHMVIQHIFNNMASNIAEELDKIIPKNRQYFEFLNVGISFFSQKVDEYEQQYQRWQRTGSERYFDPLFEQINPVYAKRIVTFFEIVVRNSYSGECLARAILTEISGFVTAWVTRKIFENAEKLEHEKRRDLHSAGFRPKQVPCQVCGGYYFQH